MPRAERALKETGKKAAKLDAIAKVEGVKDDVKADARQDVLKEGRPEMKREEEEKELKPKTEQDLPEVSVNAGAATRPARSRATSIWPKKRKRRRHSNLAGARSCVCTENFANKDCQC